MFSKFLSIFSTSNPKPPKVKTVIQFKYRDGEDLIQGLNNILGKGKYDLQCRNDCWIVIADRELSKEELSKLEEDAHVHY